MDDSDLLEPVDDRKGDTFAILPPFESFLDIKEKYLERHFFASIKVGDIICGEVRSSRSTGFPVDVQCVSFGPVRDLKKCRIRGFLPFKSMPPLTSKAMEKGDFVRAVVSEIDNRHDELILSLQQSALPKRVASVNLGIIDNDELPLYYRKIVRSSPLESSNSFTDLMESSTGFVNPSCVATLVQSLGIDDINCKSELPSLRRLKIPEEEFALNLRQKQSRQHALQCVELGIRYAKRGEVAAAVRQFNRALDLDHDNIEALVARGAFYANREDFKKAIENFEKAFSIDPNHAEARTYLYESLVGQALSHSKDRCYESARRCLRKAGDIIPEKRPELEKMASKFVSPSLLIESTSSPLRNDCPETDSPKCSKHLSPPVSNDRSSKKHMRAITLSSSSSSSSPSFTSSLSSDRSQKKKKKKKRHNSSKDAGRDSSDSLKLTGVSFDARKVAASMHKAFKSPNGKGGEVVRHYSSAKRPRLEKPSSSELPPRRLRHSMSSIDSFAHLSQNKAPDHSFLRRDGESLEDMERFLQDLKQKRN